MLLKLDILKAFDSVSWTFLLEVLEKLGFETVWRDIISGLLSSSSTWILLNGMLGGFYHSQAGVVPRRATLPYALHSSDGIFLI
jgi:hypothetical protein